MTTGTRVLKPVSEAGNAYVIKACHAGGRLKLFSCVLGRDFSCELGPTPESSNFSSSACTGPTMYWTKTPTCLVTGTSNITVGAQLSTPSSGDCGMGSTVSVGGATVSNAFNGAMEEIFIQRISLENITAHLFSCPACGCINYYLWGPPLVATVLKTLS